AVTYTAPTTGATARLSATSVLTDPFGQASVNAIAGNVAGTFTVVASVPGLETETASFNLTNILATAGTIVVVSGSEQSAPVGTPFTVTLTAAVRDQRGNPIPGVTVVFTIPQSGASTTLSTLTRVTDNQGNVSVTAVANGTAGSYQVTATANGYSGSA